MSKEFNPNILYVNQPAKIQSLITKRLGRFNHSSGNEYGCKQHQHKNRLAEPDRYPEMMVNGYTTTVARWIAYKYYQLDLMDKNQQACHRCNTGGADHKWCTNKYHIYRGTARMNRMDAINNGTDDPSGLRTFSTGMAKLNENQVKEVRKWSQTLTNAQIQENLLRNYGISITRQTLAMIIHHQTYKCVK